MGSWNSISMEVLYQVLGWIAFFSWSFSFYPQVILNYRRKSVVGLNFDFLVLNATKHSSYLIYNASLFFSPVIQRQYREKYGSDEMIPVGANDVAFSIHAVMLTFFGLFQVLIYDRGTQKVSKTCTAISSVVWATALVCIIVSWPTQSWLWLISVFNTIQVIMTTIKYVPQAFMNFKRKSTIGWSIGNIILDLGGGVMNFAQMSVQSIDQGTLVNFYGNIGKTLLSLFIPPIFACTIGDLVKQTVFLRDSSGQSWRVKFSMINGRVAFQEGWPDFVLDHSITLGELLVFRCRGHSTLEVEIFGTNACIRKNFDVENKENNTKSNRKMTEVHHETQVYKRRKTSNVSEHRCKVENHDSVDKVTKEKSSYRVTGKEVNRVSHSLHDRKKSVPTRLETAPLKLNYIRALNDAIDENDEEHEAVASPSVPLCASKRDRVNKDFLRSHSLENKFAQNSTENLINFEEVAGRFLLTDDGVCHIYDRLPSEKEKRVCEKEKLAMSKAVIDLTKDKDKNCRSNAKKIRKKPQGKGIFPVVISRVENDVPAKHVGSASPNTSFQKHHKHPHIATGYSCQSGQLLKRVKEEINPCFKGKTIQVKTEPMDGSTLAPPAFANVRFSLSVSAQTSWIKLPVKLPSQFGRAKHSRKVIQLRDPSMRLWPILYHEDIKFVGFIGGWEHFARGNKLQEGDSCEFGIAEESESTLQVHTVRA